MTSWNRVWVVFSLGTLLLAIAFGVFGGIPGVAGMLFYWFVGVIVLYVVGRALMRWSTDPIHVLIGIITVASAWLAALAVDGSARMMLRTHYALGADLPGPTLFALEAIKAYGPWILAVGATTLVLWAAIQLSRYVVHVCAATAAVTAITLSLAAFTLVILPSMRCTFEWPPLSIDPAPGNLGTQAGASPGSCRGGI